MADYLSESFCDNAAVCATGRHYVHSLDWDREFMADDLKGCFIDAPEYSPAGSCKRYADFMGGCQEQSILKRGRLVP